MSEFFEAGGWGMYPPLLFAMVRGTSFFELHRKRSAPLTDLVEPLVDLFLHGAEKHR